MVKTCYKIKIDFRDSIFVFIGFCSGVGTLNKQYSLFSTPIVAVSACKRGSIALLLWLFGNAKVAL